jgi:hypothetical protein
MDRFVDMPGGSDGGALFLVWPQGAVGHSAVRCPAGFEFGDERGQGRRVLLDPAEPNRDHPLGQWAYQRLVAGGGEPSVTIASGFAATSAYSWLKIPVIEDMDRVAEAAACAAGMAVSP